MSTVDPFSPWAESEVEEGMSELMRAVPQPSALSEVSRGRVELRLRSPRSSRAGLALLRLVAVGVVIGVTSAALAQWVSVHWLGAQETLVTRPATVAASGAGAVLPKLPRRGPALAPEPVEIVEAAPSAVDSPPSPAAAAISATTQSSRLGLEAASLEAVLSALRGGGAERAQVALQAVDRHLREFPGGALELEARVARVDALLKLGRRQDARRELSSLPLERVGRKNELRLIRAELRADDDCSAALADFQVLVDQSLPTSWAERALFGRGACLLKLGDRAGAGRDFARYLERFPDGRFAPQIRAQSVKP